MKYSRSTTAERIEMEKILLIDDSIFICDIITKILTDSTTEVIAASTAGQSFALLEQMTPDLILLDMVLPDIHGYQVCRQLKGIDKLKEVPIIFITATNDVNSIVQGFEAGATDYICKPFSAEELNARVSCHLQKKLMADELQKTNNRLMKMMEEIKLLSYKDILTNCFNRRYFLENIEAWKNQIKDNPVESCLFLVDVDVFKNINDTYGHIAGDYVLYTIADFLKEGTGDNIVVGRWGGDEFLIIAFSLSLADAVNFGNQLKDKVARHSFTYGNIKFNCSLTIGITKIYPDISIEENLDRADKALYIGKERGRNCCISEEEIAEI